MINNNKKRNNKPDICLKISRIKLYSEVSL
jgi:hypothetical protein